MKLIEFNSETVPHEPRERTSEVFKYMQDATTKDVYLFVFVTQRGHPDFHPSKWYQIFKLVGESWNKLEQGEYTEERLDHYTLVSGGYKSSDDLGDCYYGNVKPETVLRRMNEVWHFMANTYEWSVN